MAVLAFVLLVTAAAQETVLKPVATTQPNVSVFPPRGEGRQYGPAHNAIDGPKQTNKFWANWGVDNPSEGAEKWAIYVMPYGLMWLPSGNSNVSELAVSHNYLEEVVEYGYGSASDANIGKYYTPFRREFSLGSVEEVGEQHQIIKEGLFGVHMEVQGPAGNESVRKITYPFFQGMAYVSGQYSGDITPKVAADGIMEVTKVRSGIWKFVNERDVEFRVYALTDTGDFVDNSYMFGSDGVMNKNLAGWLRLAHVVSTSDAAILDDHAGSILWDWELDVKFGGQLEYRFTTVADATDLVHFAFPHHVPLLAANDKPGMVSRGPTKGEMTAVVGTVWSMEVDIDAAEALEWLPTGDTISEERKEYILGWAKDDLEHFKGNWKPELLKGSFYWSGKGFQKLGTVCLILEELDEEGNEATEACADILAEAFRCMYAVDTGEECPGAPIGSYYDELWGGIPSKDGFFPGDKPCYDLDFGNACYNDHHYHYGYFVVSAAILVKLRPELKADVAFVDWVNTLIRDTANPSTQDEYFPHFRSFDWFDFHSWSRGVMPSRIGKDQESTSEEINLLYGLILWGGVMNEPSIKSLGATMMALETMAIKAYFLMKNDNPNHRPEFARNHVTGIFFQAEVRYDTWFGQDTKYMHGIQMLPLSPALQLTRDVEFCTQEWEDVLFEVPLSETDPWSSMLITGGLAMFRRDDAWYKLQKRTRESLDDGLTKSGSLYWTAKQAPQIYDRFWSNIIVVSVIIAIGAAIGGLAFRSASAQDSASLELPTVLVKDT